MFYRAEQDPVEKTIVERAEAPEAGLQRRLMAAEAPE